MECGCLINLIEWQKEINFCPLHAAAPELLEALKLCERALEVRDTEAEEYAAKNARTTITKAESK